MDDAELVAAALAGDRDAYAAMYDRYADRIHDFCASILRNRADSSDALQETFLVAFEVLDQLAEPARLRSWLFAIAHRSILDRMGRPGSLTGDDDLTGGTWSGGSEGWEGSRETLDERLSRAELAEFVWQISAGLPERDRVLLDLHLRQGLEGRDLASAAGVPAPQLDTRLSLLEGNVERSLGALLVARTGRRRCADLSFLLEGAGEGLTAEFRDRVTAHVDDCEVCNSRRRILPSPLALLTATPMTAAPAYLRAVLLGRAELEAVQRQDEAAPRRVVASSGWAFNRDGFPDLSEGEPGGGDRPTGPIYASTPRTAVLPVVGPNAGATAARATAARATAARATAVRATAPTTYLPTYQPPPPPEPPPGPLPTSGDNDRRGILVGALAGLIILIAAVVIVISNRSPGPAANVGVGTTTSTVTAATQTSDTTSATTIPVVVPSTDVAPTTLVINGHLVVGGSHKLDLGTTSSSGSLIVGNDGQAPLTFTAGASGPGLMVDPVAGTLGSGASQSVTVTLDRSVPPQGSFAGSIQITSGAGNATVAVTALIDSGPMISGETAMPASVVTAKCTKLPHQPTMSTITASVTGSMPLKIVVLHWQGTGSNGSGTATMTSTGSTAPTYAATLPAFALASPVEWWVTAIDNAGVTATSMTQSLPVNAC